MIDDSFIEKDNRELSLIETNLRRELELPFVNDHLGGIDLADTFIELGPIDHLNSEDTARCRAALVVIQAIGPSAAQTLPAVYPLLDRPSLSDAAADTIGCLGSVAKSVLPDLIERLIDSDVIVRRTAARALASFGLLGMDALPALINQLTVC